MSRWPVRIFGTRMVEPAFSTDFCGMLLAWRITSAMWKREASELMLSRALVILCVVQVDSSLVHWARFRWNFSAFSFGSRILVSSSPVMTGRLNCGFRALNSSTDSSARWAATVRSISLVLSTAVKYGVLSMAGRFRPYCCGLATMFLTACSLGT
jgi:hypothetical protein